MFKFRYLSDKNYFYSNETHTDETWVTPLSNQDIWNPPADIRLNVFNRPRSEMLIVTRETYNNSSKLMLELFLARNPDTPVGCVEATYIPNPSSSSQSGSPEYDSHAAGQRLANSLMADYEQVPLDFWPTITNLFVNKKYEHTHYKLLLLYLIISEIKANHGAFVYVEQPSPKMKAFYRGFNFLPCPELADHVQYGVRHLVGNLDMPNNLNNVNNQDLKTILDWRLNVRHTHQYWRGQANLIYPEVMQKMNIYFQPALDDLIQCHENRMTRLAAEKQAANSPGRSRTPSQASALARQLSSSSSSSGASGSSTNSNVGSVLRPASPPPSPFGSRFFRNFMNK